MLKKALTLLCFSVIHFFVSPLTAAPPNIPLIVSEDNGPDLGCYGDPNPDCFFSREPAVQRDTTPAIEKPANKKKKKGQTK